MEPLDFFPGHPSFENHLCSGALINWVGILICKKILHWKNIFSKLDIEKDLFFKFNSASFCSSFLTWLDLVLLYGIIWYEKFGSDQPRTLINQVSILPTLHEQPLF